MERMGIRKLTSALLATAIAAGVAGCGGAAAAQSAAETKVVDDASASQSDQAALVTTEMQDQGTSEVSSATLETMANDGIIDTTDLFTTRDLEQEADLVGATYLSLVSGQDVTITEEGVYVLVGDVTDVTVSVEADDAAKVQLVLDNVSITNADAPAIYVKSADKVFVTTVQDSQNYLSVTSAFVADGDTNTDAVIFSKDDLVLNGLGTLTVSSTANGVTSKDDLKVTGGTYVITSEADALEANDSIRIAGGTFDLTSSKDGLHAENDEDDTTGFIYICDGSLAIDASDDAIQGTTYVQIDGGALTLSGEEAIEATYVQVNGGDISINAWDDGVNASYKSQSIGDPVVEIRGGNLSVTMAQGDTDALDSNGYLYVSGGTVDISAQSAFDYDLGGEYTGGTIYVNGEQVNELSASMMGGPGMGGPGMGGHGMGDPAMGEMQGGRGF